MPSKPAAYIAPTEPLGSAPHQLVDEAEFERQLLALRAEIRDPDHGLFGPDSEMWQLARNGISLIGSWRASFLQLAHPGVAAAVRDFSQTRHDPIRRFHGTFQVVLGMLYGDADQAFRMARQMHRMHAGITGKVKECPHKSGANTDAPEAGRGGHPDLETTPYAANLLDALLWVNATLWETIIVVHEELFGELPLERKERFYQETKRFAMLFGIPYEALPASWPDFLAYNEAMWHSEELQVIPSAREMADFLLEVNRFPFPKPVCKIGRRFTLKMLPPVIREKYGFPEITAKQARRLRLDLRLLRTYHRLSPKLLRYGPSYHEAHRRIRSGRRGSWPVRCINRLMLGTWDVVAPSS